VISEYPKFQIFRRVPLLTKYDGTGTLSKEELDKFEHSEYLDDMSENGNIENIPDVIPDIDGELNAGTYGNNIYAPDNANSTDNTDNTDITGEIPEITPYYVTESEYSDEDLYWMARIVQAEAGHEGYNGWVAVAEVISNRVASPKYPNSVYEVVSQSGQFTTFSKARKYNDTDLDVQLVEACRQVLAGRLQVLGNKDVMYFYNPKASSSKYHKGRTPFVEIGNHMFLI
jgi:spore germination cell wall hydrolase CwlJ-like protein